MKFRLILFLLAISTSIEAQVRLLGSVKDSASSKAIEGVHIMELDANKGATSNSNGIFILHADALPIDVKITHVSYHDKVIHVSSRDDLKNIKLSSRTYILGSVDVGARRPKNIIKNTKLYVIDYEFKGDSIVLLAYKDRKNSKKQIVLLSGDGDTIRSRNLQKMDGLYKDCFDNSHLLTDVYAYQLHFQDKKIEFIHPVERDSLIKTFDMIIEKSGPYFYIRTSEYANQVVKFYIYDSRDSSLTLWRTIADEGGLERLGDKARLQSAEGYSEHDARFEEMAFYAPKFIPLVKREDSILIFNHLDSRIEVYNTAGEEIGSIAIHYHENRKWKEEMYVDEATGKVYTLYKVGGISYLKQINAQTGEIAKTIKVPEFLHIENIKVHNNKLYFLFNDSEEYNYKQLFSMNI